MLFVAVMASTASLRSQMTDEQKKALFLMSQKPTGSGDQVSGRDTSKKSGSELKIKSPPRPETSPSPSKTIQSKKSKSAKSKKHHLSHSDQSTHHSESPSKLHHSSNTEEIPPVRSTVASGASQPHPPTSPNTSTESYPAHPPESATPTLPLPHGTNPSAPITIEKSSVDAAVGFEPAPSSPPSVSHGWSWLFGSHRTYNYLSSSTRYAIDHAAVRRGRWKYIVVHNSGTREGNARVFDIYHRRVRHMVNGLAYHFVIGNGHGSGDGQIEIGHRWTAQLNGGHVASDYLNDIALGICLVGDFNRDLPTKAQIEALDELVSYLRDRVGKTQGRQAIVHAHKEINPRPTDCPGDRFPYHWLHSRFGNVN